MLRLAGIRFADVPGPRGELFAGPGNDVCLLLIDGNKVGKRFVETPSLKRPGLSLRFTTELRDHWVSGVRAVQGVAGDRLAIDPVYFGGDDVALYLPHEFLGDFCAAFAESAGDGDMGVTFCYLAIVFSHAQDRDEGGRLSNTAIGIADELMRMAKKGDSVHQAAMAVREGKVRKGVAPNKAEVLRAYAGNYLWGYTLRIA